MCVYAEGHVMRVCICRGSRDACVCMRGSRGADMCVPDHVVHVSARGGHVVRMWGGHVVCVYARGHVVHVGGHVVLLGVCTVMCCMQGVTWCLYVCMRGVTWCA